MNTVRIYGNVDAATPVTVEKKVASYLFVKRLTDNNAQTVAAFGNSVTHTSHTSHTSHTHHTLDREPYIYNVRTRVIYTFSKQKIYNPNFKTVAGESVFYSDYSKIKRHNGCPKIT